MVSRRNGELMFGEFKEASVAVAEARDARLATDQNAARLAYSVHNHESSGVGSVRVSEPIMFDVTFIQRPSFTQGAGVVRGADAATFHDPVGTAGVYEWIRDKKEAYVGARIYLDIVLRRRDGEIPEAWPEIRMMHDLQFMGFAYKDLGSAVAVQAETNGVRTPGFGA